MRPAVSVICALALCLGVACFASERPAAAPPRTTSPAARVNVPEPKGRDAKSWRKERYISVDEAVDRLQAHVDVTIVLPRDHLAGLRRYKGWMADPRYIDWERRGGRRVGTLVLRKDEEILGIDIGYASPDGCGGRDTAIPTEVRGAPALLWSSPQDVWSRLVWPVRRGASTGRFGLSGTFEGWQIVRLARSMETESPATAADRDGC